MTLHRIATPLVFVLALAACGPDAPVAAPPAPPAAGAEAPATAATDPAALPELRYYQISDG